MTKEPYLEFKVGVFVLVAIISLFMFIFSISDTAMFDKGKTIKVVFSFANGLKKGAPVRMAGVDEGIVKDIKLFFDRNDGKTKAEAELKISLGIKIPVDSSFMINQLGLMGEKYLEIFPGVDTKNFLKDQQIVFGADPIAQELISQKVLQTINKVDEAITGINIVLADKKKMESVGIAIEELSSIVTKVDSVLNNIEKGKGTIGRLIYDETLYDNLQKIGISLDGILADIQSGEGNVGRFIKDDAIYENLKELSADLKNNPWKLLYRQKDK